VSKATIEYVILDFPTVSINEKTKRDTGITDEFIDEILLTQKDDIYAFSILALLYPDLDYKNNNFHKDHLHPENKFDMLNTIDKEKYGWLTYNSILNLQMLDANENMSKQNVSLSEWIEINVKTQDRNKFLTNHLIPDISLKLDDFGIFIEARKKILFDRLKDILS
jgi:hypothetical protein